MYSSFEEHDTDFRTFQQETGTTWCIYSRKNRFRVPLEELLSDYDSLRFVWSYSHRDTEAITVNDDSVPFALCGYEKYECHLGKDRHVLDKQKRMESLQHIKDRRTRKVPKSKKINCKSRIVFSRLVRFPEFKVERNSRSLRAAKMKELQQCLKGGRHVLTEERYFARYPRPISHSHYVQHETASNWEVVNEEVEMLTRRRPVAPPVNSANKKACIELAEQVLQEIHQLKDETAIIDGARNQLQSILTSLTKHNQEKPVVERTSAPAVEQQPPPEESVSPRSCIRAKRRRIARSTPTISLVTKQSRTRQRTSSTESPQNNDDS